MLISSFQLERIRSLEHWETVLMQHSQLMQYEILEKMVTYIELNYSNCGSSVYKMTLEFTFYFFKSEL